MKGTGTMRKIQIIITGAIVLTVMTVSHVAWAVPTDVRFEDLAEGASFYTVDGVRHDCVGERCENQQLTVPSPPFARTAIFEVQLLEPGTMQISDDFQMWFSAGELITHFCFVSDVDGSDLALCPTPSGFERDPAPTRFAENGDYQLMACVLATAGTPCPDPSNVVQFRARSDVSEPPTWILFTTACLGLLGFGLLRRKPLAGRVTSQDPERIPEPA